MAPDRLWMLLIVPFIIIAYIWALRRKKKTGMRFTNTTLLAAVMPRQSQWRRHVAVGAALLALIALTAAWARPNGIEMMPRERATIVMVIDVSLSMQATDIEPNRLEAEKEAAIKFLNELPAQFNVSVVSLSGSPSALMLPTTDREAATNVINSLDFKESTAIGEAIYTAISSLQQAPAGDDDSMAPGAIVLLSDGVNTAGRAPAQAAAEAGNLEVPIYTIAYGTDNGWVDLDGKRERVQPDVPTLQHIAERTGGQYYRAEDVSGLEKVYSNIGSVVGQMPVEKEITATWAGYGLIFAAIAALAAVSMGARWP
jgi:Ca-activated chloride channel family protein